MTNVIHPFNLLVVGIASGLDRHQQAVIECSGLVEQVLQFVHQFYNLVFNKTKVRYPIGCPAASGPLAVQFQPAAPGWGQDDSRR